MSKQKRLLILSCSARKTDAGLCRAIDRYQGPSFFVVRRWLRQNNLENTVIWIVSAKYGLIGTGKMTSHYDLALTPQRAAFLARTIRVQFQVLNKFSFEAAPPSSVFCHLPKNYRDAIDDYISSFPVKIEFAKGAPGEKLRQLKDWLEGNNGFGK